MQHEMFQTLMDVIRFGKTITALGAVYYAMLHRAVTPAILYSRVSHGTNY